MTVANDLHATLAAAGEHGPYVMVGHSLGGPAGTFRDLGDRPIVVLTAMAPMDSASLAALEMTKAQGVAFKAEWNTLQVEEAGWSTNSRHEVLPDATHYIQMDRPDVVIRAVRDVVEAVRTGTPVAGPQR